MWAKKEQFTINVSNKKILQGLLSEIKISEDKQYQVLKTIDKLERLGFEGVEQLLKEGQRWFRRQKGVNYLIIKLVK